METANEWTAAVNDEGWKKPIIFNDDVTELLSVMYKAFMSSVIKMIGTEMIKINKIEHYINYELIYMRIECALTFMEYRTFVINADKK